MFARRGRGHHAAMLNDTSQLRRAAASIPAASPETTPPAGAVGFAGACALTARPDERADVYTPLQINPGSRALRDFGHLARV